MIEISHDGIDIKALTGDKVMAIANGIIEAAEFDAEKGNLIKIKHLNNENGKIYYSYYAHLSKIEVEIGDKVSVGEKIGEAGSTGKATGPHLHLEIRDAEYNSVDPLEFLK